MIAINILNPSFKNGAYQVTYRRKNPIEPYRREVLITADKETIEKYFSKMFTVKDFEIIPLSEERAKQKSQLIPTYIIRTYK